MYGAWGPSSTASWHATCASESGRDAMRYLALACDYDGTVARDGRVSAAARAAGRVERGRGGGAPGRGGTGGGTPGRPGGGGPPPATTWWAWATRRTTTPSCRSASARWPSPAPSRSSGKRRTG